MTTTSIAPKSAPPIEGFPVGNSSLGFDVIMPLSISQCEPVLIWYNITIPQPVVLDFWFPSAVSDPSTDWIVQFSLPAGAGYLDWICNIPTGVGFFASVPSGNPLQYYVVLPGSSTCLGDLTAAYSGISYNTTVFSLFSEQTVINPLTVTGFSPIVTQTTPMGPFSTITVNPISASTTSSTSSSSSIPVGTPTSPPSSSGLSSPQPTSLGGPQIAGVVIGTLVVFLIICAGLFYWHRLSGQTQKEDPAPQTTSASPPGLVGVSIPLLHVPPTADQLDPLAGSSNVPVNVITHSTSTVQTPTSSHHPSIHEIRENLIAVPDAVSRSTPTDGLGVWDTDVNNLPVLDPFQTEDEGTTSLSLASAV